MSQKRICEICGEIQNVNDMHEIFTGRMKYVCLNCYKQGSMEIKARLCRKKANKVRNE